MVSGLVVLLLWQATRSWTLEKLGFAYFVAFYLLNPFVFPSPDPDRFRGLHLADAAVSLTIVLATIALAWRGRARLAAQPVTLFLLTMLVALLVPVSSLTGSPRYVYAATVPAALLAGQWFASTGGTARRVASVGLVVFVVVSVAQLFEAGRAWRWAGAMVGDGLRTMSAALEPCGERDLLLLTMPVGLRGVYTHFYWDAFLVQGCAPREIQVMLRIERADVRVRVTRLGADVIEMRIAGYAGNGVTSRDLRHFDVAVEAGAAMEVQNPAGKLRTFPDGSDQVFRVELVGEEKRRAIFFYGDGRMQAVP